MEKATRGLPESPARRAARIARVGASYGFGFVFGNRFVPRRRRVEPGRVGMRLRLSFEELGPTFAELGRFLSARRDLLPSDVAVELERTTVAVKPLPFAETRALVERELGNTLERLFLEFEEVPSRVGTFTQAHRAMLPGERPALAVVVRSGVRRDLLAMRPVADIARRRLSDRLPLDPTAVVAEFAAHAVQRRDMFFAAQTARRLKEMDSFRLRAPDVYRGYSSGRCITFAASVGSAPLEADQYLEVSEALVRVAVEEGVFLADLTPERFTADGSEIWLADPTEAFYLDPERLRGVSEVLAAVRRGDVDGVVRALPLAGGFVPRDDSILRRELREALGALGGPLWREHSLEEVRDRGLEAFRRGGAPLHVEAAQMMRFLVEAEGIRGDGQTEIVPAADAAEVLISRYRDPAYIAARTARRLAQPDTYADYPRQIHTLLNELKDGEIEVRFRHAGLDELISKVDILANRLVFGLLIAALILGSSVLGIFVEGGSQFLGLSVFGLVGFVFAAILGLLLLIGIIRSGRL
ncbi:MAG TPA: AarF/UbiB family protein [Rubrobacteraceae bacterium]|nr:AarF/UbiB family protein [Rubrobacteraceae bacterium]